MLGFLLQKSFGNFRTATLITKLKPTKPSLCCLPKRYQVTYVDPITRGISDAARKKVGYWLMGMAGLTFGVIIVGGVTRLTESGLSMVDWHPFKEVPPRTEEQWLAEFEKYKQFPEYEHVLREHGEMTLSRFKFIWHMEYGHRQLGRLIGVAYAIPAALFWYKGYFNKVMKIRVASYGALIGFQGLLGWYMVRSGLKTPPRPAGLDPNEEFVGVPRVSHYRLAAHLSTAAILYSLFLWAGFSHLFKHPHVVRFPQLRNLKIMGHSTKAMMFTALVFGAFVAGLDAGLTYNSWPKMADRWIPDDLITPTYGSTKRNLVENPTAVQWMHRNLAYLTCGLATATWLATLRVPGGRKVTGQRMRTAAHLMLAATVGQSAIGIFTLLNYVPVWLGAMHQGGSLVLLSAILWYTHCIRAIPK
ncbi:unnamed protein product [Rodentolepis nana]|uniref:Cytochrome c oxidase assembly protein COX15 n=1 Tax=Rodentolepis nana TaxID=102285 RepID=A0A0R3TQX8_RODNA|nr:unnamed protein product [Rodentolepis nana]